MQYNISSVFPYLLFSDLGSTASSGRRSAAFSNIYGDKYGRQSSVITSEKTSIASGSGVSGGPHVADSTDGTHLTPQQLGVMGELRFQSINWNSSRYKSRSKHNNLQLNMQVVELTRKYWLNTCVNLSLGY